MVHSAKPHTVKLYMPAEMSCVCRDLMIFHACGVKLIVDARAAADPMRVIASTP